VHPAWHILEQKEESAVVGDSDFQPDASIIGIIGGMGPMATIELFRQIVLITPASIDQQHLHLLIDNNPRIPDRTAAILGTGPDPLPALLSSGLRLERAGASLLIMPCNTAHYWLEPLQEGLHTPVLSMVEATAKRVHRALPTARAIGLLATRGTVLAGIYQRALAEFEIDLVLPDERSQEIVSEVIYAVKAGKQESDGRTELVADELISQGAEGVILGCTELSVLSHQIRGVDLFDPLRILAGDVVRAVSGWTGS